MVPYIEIQTFSPVLFWSSISFQNISCCLGQATQNLIIKSNVCCRCQIHITVSFMFLILQCVRFQVIFLSLKKKIFTEHLRDLFFFIIYLDVCKLMSSFQKFIVNRKARNSCTRSDANFMQYIEFEYSSKINNTDYWKRCIVLRLFFFPLNAESVQSIYQFRLIFNYYQIQFS